jgi:hypothetical protein
MLLRIFSNFAQIFEIMSDFKLCPNGHYYPDNMDDCPYCPKTSQNITNMESGKTKLDSGDSPVENKTKIYGGNTGGKDLGKTKIHHTESSDAQPHFNYGQNTAGRKLTGWLVSYTIDPLGVDFRIYEGRNIIGSDPGCDIVISGDSSVSTKHLTILYRMGVFKFKDELSTNGTFVNDEFKEEGTLNDGDNIKIGSTVLKFRTAG